jgi:hypothetical protein
VVVLAVMTTLLVPVYGVMWVGVLPVDGLKCQRLLTSLRSEGSDPAIIPIPDSTKDQRTILVTLSVDSLARLTCWGMAFCRQLTQIVRLDRVVLQIREPNDRT